MSTRASLTAIAALLVATVARDAAAEPAWIVEPGPEVADAQKLGAADVKRAQGLAKKKQYADAARVLEEVARKWPAAVHDCNLALAYLRAGALTRAQLVWELSALRNGARPSWCTGEVSTQLSTALRAAGFVPTTFEVVPAEAVIEVGGVAIRRMRMLWLPPGPATVAASAPTLETKTITTTIAAPSAHVAITLEPPAAAVVEPPKPEPEPEKKPEPEPVGQEPKVPVETLPPVEPVPVRDDEGGGRNGLRIAAISAGLVGWIGAGITGYMTHSRANRANELYPTDPAFDDAVGSYRSAKYATIGFSVLGGVGTAVFVYLLATDGRSAGSGVAVSASPDGFGVSFSGSFGASR